MDFIVPFLPPLTEKDKSIQEPLFLEIEEPMYIPLPIKEEKEQSSIIIIEL